MMNILAAVQIAGYFSFAVIMTEINPTDHKSITAHHFPRGSGFRLTFRSGEIMDRANAIIACIMFGAWIRKIRKTSLKGFGTIRQNMTL